MSQVPYLQLQEEAEAFLTRYHSIGSLPVPIEKIVEFGIGLEIVPIPSLMMNFGMDGCLSNDLQTITVDQDVMENFVNRYRFTLAHEIGHWWLHGQFIRSRDFDSIESWRTAMAAIPQATYRRLELQANGFASFVLVPPNDFEAKFSCLNKQGSHQEIVAELASQFEVSAQVVEIRIQKLASTNA